MIELFSVFTFGGIVLFQYKDPFGQVNEGPVNDLVQSVFIESKGDASLSHTSGPYGMQYRKSNELSLIFVVVYRKSLESKLTYTTDLLSNTFNAFVESYRAERKPPSDFADTFARIRNQVELEFRTQPAARAKAMPTFEETEKFKQSKTATNPDKKQELQKKAQEQEESSDEPSSPSSGDMSEEAVRARIARLGLKARPGKGGPASPSKKPSPTTTTAAAAAPAEKTKKAKENRVWMTANVSSSGPASSDPEVEENSEDVQKLKQFVGRGTGDLRDIDEVDGGSESGQEEAEEEAGKAKEGKKAAAGGGIFSFFKNLGGGSVITSEALDPVLEQTRLALIAKNVAAEVALKLCNSIRDSLVGKSKGAFTSIASEVRRTLDKSLTQILTPGRRIDVLREVLARKAEGGKTKAPYSMVFCGVNGVGKSTNLAKICFWLVENKLRVLIAACDTFRAGAVEQLRTHVRRLSTIHPDSVAIFERGYGKDDAEIAQQAIAFARNEGYDVVLVDTAGRMQDNDPLMRSLAKILQVNRPDLVLFVGDALAGNEASDQLAKFNKHLEYVQNGSSLVRGIDGIVLTKFDTIDDKVGASISMTYQNGQPIVFVGTGQDYPDLKRLNVGAVVKSLLG